MTDEALSTFLAEAEKILNDRPITPVGEDTTDPEPLTPSKLLLLKNNSCLPLGTFEPTEQYSRRWWRQAQYLANVFWKRWIREYLPSLQERQKWLTVKNNFSEDDLVLVVDENLQRGQWPLGRVLETVPGDDGLVRSVKVRTSGSTKFRPIHKLVRLENSKTWSAEAPTADDDEGTKDTQHDQTSRPKRERQRPKKLEDFVSG